jgi:protein RecA
MANNVKRKPVVSKVVNNDATDDLINVLVDSVNKSLKKEDSRVTVGDDDSEYGQSVPYWVRTNIPQLDYAVGGKNHPGFPGARITEIFGAEGSGKSTLAVWLIKCFIDQMNTFVVYQDAENVLTKEIIKGTGLNMKRVVLQNPDTLEDAFQTQEAMLDTLEKQAEKGEKKPIACVLDSVAACPTEAEIDADYGDATVATQARMMSKALKKIKTRILNDQVLSVFVNQIRDKMNVSWGKTYTTSGGRALPFYASVRIEMTRTGYVKGGNGVPNAGTYKATVIKNKVSPPMKTAEFQIDYIEDENGNSYPKINVNLALLNWCKSNGLLGGSQGRVEIKGKSYYFKDADALLAGNKALFDEIVELAYSVGDGVYSDSDEDDE